MVISWHWIPGKSIGPFLFGEPAEEIIHQHRLLKLEEPEYLENEWDTYEIPDYESRVSVRDGLIEDVLCHDALIYEGRDLLGIKTDEVRTILGNEEELVNAADPWDAVLYYYKLGLTVWIKNNITQSANCGAPF